MNIKSVQDDAFRAYGRVIELPLALTEELINAMKETERPENGTIYVPGDERIEQLSITSVFEKDLFGGLPVQVGYCNGVNQKLNALEFHKNSEINVACDDLILILGHQQDITNDNTYDTGLCEAFKVPKGTVVEIYATTLHYAPCGVDGAGFRCVVVLPKGTNLEIPEGLSGVAGDELMTARNKWLIAHEEAKIEGAVNGLIGENLSV